MKMSSAATLLQVKGIASEIVPFLESIGEIFRIFDQQDSGCISFGVKIGSRKYFVKSSETMPAIKYLQNAIHFNSIVKSKYLPGLLHSFIHSKRSLDLP